MSDFFDEKNELSGEFTKEQLEEKKPQKGPSNRKDTIKNVAIAFLSVMLVLTFFSNTIMNFSLPQVATQMIESGSISPQVRGSGTVSAEDPYNITVKETRKISGVAVKEGAHVEIGDIIYYLEDKESQELKEAKENLQTLELSYEQTLFSGDVPDKVISNVRSGRNTTYDTYQAELKAADDKYDAAKAADEAAQAEIDYLTQLAAYDAAGTSYNAATPAYTTAQAEHDLLIAQQNGDTEKVEELERFISENNKDTAQLTNYGTQQGLSYSQKLATATQKKNKTAQDLVVAEREKTELLKSINTEIGLCQSRDKIKEQKEKIAKLEEESVGASVKSPVAGIVSEVSKVSGESTSADETIAVIQVDGKDMTTSFSVTNAQAQKLKIGDAAQPQNAWQFGSDFKATLTGIRNDKSDPSNRKLLTFKIESKDVTPGQSISLTIGERAVDYDMIVPNSAIKTDSNGKFILAVVSKSTPLGNRYIASKVEVQVVASDDKNSAISGALDGDEYVITTSTQPIKSGDQVRLANG
ncbi:MULTISPECIES: HlyD family efflux transporter periplasmic adaptor subunit [unclassified Butyrivibrio]|uniref:HlyD family efflux transporter periplasmic adaptor subunit n=1 Tax=unclassified Butyrivibrio TaxID=2639466 RepID=UPI0003B473E6|nr:MULTISPECIES: HlyD family efflux transporter periplasmic adaptor subunit [unclassified Butyrivibrio]MDC7295094.1 HlyD family secretion protein [Butyrivibrio sp. DSM 10294]